MDVIYLGKTHLQSPAMRTASHLPATGGYNLTVGVLVDLGDSTPCCAQELPGYMSVKKVGSPTVLKSSSTAKPIAPPAPPTFATPAGKPATVLNTSASAFDFILANLGLVESVVERSVSARAVGTARAAVGALHDVGCRARGQSPPEVAAAVAASWWLHQTF